MMKRSVICRSFSENDLRLSFSKRRESQIDTIQHARADYVAVEAASHNNSNAMTLHTSNQDLLQQSSLCNENSTITLVVVPSMDLDDRELNRMSSRLKGKVVLYEERQLYHLLLLRNPRFRIIFLSSNWISADVVNYYISLDSKNSKDIEDRLSRLFILSPGGATSKSSLSSKVVKHDNLLYTIREIIKDVSYGDSPSAGLSVFTGSHTADNLSNRLGLRLLEAESDKLYFGTKQGSREVFKASGVPMAFGTPDLELGDDDLLTTLGTSDDSWVRTRRFIRTPEALAKGIARQIVLKHRKPKLWVIKLNQGFSGKGNALLDLQSLQNYFENTLRRNRCKTIEAQINEVASKIMIAFPHMKFQCQKQTWSNSSEHASFTEQIQRLGVIAEALVESEGSPAFCPSVQAIVEPNTTNINDGHSIHLLSTHEQVLNGQEYKGCINPSSESYRSTILEYTSSIAHVLGDLGVVGHFAADYIAIAETDAKWVVNAIEINLRQGGTTHPYATMALLCGGQLDDSGIFRTSLGHQRCYVATDNYDDESLKGMNARLFLSIAKEAGIIWDNVQKVGVIFHLLTFIEFDGKLGFTAIGEDPENAKCLFKHTVQILQGIAQRKK